MRNISGEVQRFGRRRTALAQTYVLDRSLIRIRAPPSPDLKALPPSRSRPMTRDQQRDREALQGGVIVAWYCSECGRAIPVEDERTLEQDRRTHLARHQRATKP
jgi:hypothetical protein